MFITLTGTGLFITVSLSFLGGVVTTALIAYRHKKAVK
jgi:hypothetical protein